MSTKVDYTSICTIFTLFSCIKSTTFPLISLTTGLCGKPLFCEATTAVLPSDNLTSMPSGYGIRLCMKKSTSSPLNIIFLLAVIKSMTSPGFIASL